VLAHTARDKEQLGTNRSENYFLLSFQGLTSHYIRERRLGILYSKNYNQQVGRRSRVKVIQQSGRGTPTPCAGLRVRVEHDHAYTKRLTETQICNKGLRYPCAPNTLRRRGLNSDESSSFGVTAKTSRGLAGFTSGVTLFLWGQFSLPHECLTGRSWKVQNLLTMTTI
jgi:hypothetical protein